MIDTSKFASAMYSATLGPGGCPWDDLPSQMKTQWLEAADAICNTSDFGHALEELEVMGRWWKKVWS